MEHSRRETLFVGPTGRNLVPKLSPALLLLLFEKAPLFFFYENP